MCSRIRKSSLALLFAQREKHPTRGTLIHDLYAIRPALQNLLIVSFIAILLVPMHLRSLTLASSSLQNPEALMRWLCRYAHSIPQVVLLFSLNLNCIAFARVGTRVKQQFTVYTKRKAYTSDAGAYD